MKVFAKLLVAAMILFAIYEFYLNKMPTAAPGTAATQTITVTGVANDILQIAQAERKSIALNSTCASLDELIEADRMSVGRRGRDGYTYSVSCSGADFQVIAEHPPALEGSGIRYPKMMVDSSMIVQEIQ